MIQSVFGFEEVFVGDVVMRHVTIIAMGYFPVGTVGPGNVLWLHDVAVDTGLGVVGQVGGGIAEVQEENSKPKNQGYHKGRGRSPFPGRNQAFGEKESL